MEEFSKLGLSEKTVSALKKKWYEKPTSIQANVIPILLEGKIDVIGQSQTGTGKTASFGLPILEKITRDSKHVKAIILTPTRELAIQVAKEIDSLKGDQSISIMAVYGGSGIDSQIQRLRTGIDIVVGTPGRVMDLQRRRALKLDKIEYAVLDEADEMLNMGFVDDIKEILEHAPKEKSMLLFSATMPKPILEIAKTYMREYKLIKAENKDLVTNTVTQLYYDIAAKDRVEGIRRILDYYIDFHGILFCNTKASVDTVTSQLTKLGYKAAALHGDITQAQREKILEQFKNRYFQILIATDVAARGIDVNDLTHVINFSLPQSPESYLHRIGRTGRAGKEGIAITLLMPSERQRLGLIERVNKCRLEKAELPSAKEIVTNREYSIKEIIAKVIEANKGKETTYTDMAKDLLQTNTPEDIVAAVLKYSFKNELELSTYKALSKPKSDEQLPADADHRRGGRGRGGYNRNSGGNRQRSNNGGRDNRSRDRRDNQGRSREGQRSQGHKRNTSDSRNKYKDTDSSRDRSKTSRRGSDRPNRGRSRGESKGDTPATRFKNDKPRRKR